MPKYPVKLFYLDDEAKAILAHIRAKRADSEFVRLLIKSSKLNPDEKGRDLASRELDLFIEKNLEKPQ